MIKNIVKITAILLLAFIQFALLSKLSVFGAFPNLVYILAITLLLRGLLADSFLVAVIGGVVLDLGSSLRFGYYTFLLIVILLLVRLLILKFLPTPNLFISFFIFFGAFLFADLGISLFTFSWPGWSLLLDAIVNGLWGVFIYWIFSKLIRVENKIKVI